MKIVENAPEAMPMRSANANSLSVSPPKRISERIGRSVISVVASERRTVSQSDWLAMAAKLDLRISGMFSRTRSKMMIVSYIEYPRMVSRAATVAAVTSHPKSAYTPIATVMS